ncbi:MAG: tetratricopeptide repeat protein [bacterium]
MPEHRIHRKELKKKLKEDEVGVFLSELRDSMSGYMEKYGRLTLWSVVGVGLVVVVAFLWRWNQATAFAGAQETYSAAALQINREDYVAAQSTLTEMIERFGSQKCIPAAYVLRAYCHHKQEDYSAALADYRTALEKLTDQATTHSIRKAIAQCHRSLGQTSEAVTELESLRSEVQTGEMRNEITYLLAQCKEDLNQPDQALTLYQELTDGSQYKNMARQRISWLETQPVEAINSVG